MGMVISAQLEPARSHTALPAHDREVTKLGPSVKPTDWPAPHDDDGRVMSITRKSNMPWRPGFQPVSIDGHAAAVIGGTVERRTPDAPPARRRRMFGTGASARSSTASVPPSKPI